MKKKDTIRGRLFRGIRLADGTMMKFGIYRFIALFCIIIMFFGLMGCYTSNKVYKNYSPNDGRDMQLTPGSDYTLSFEAQRSTLGSFRLMINLDRCNLSSSDKANVSISNSDGEELYNTDIFLYNADRNYISIDCKGLPLKTGQRYSIRLSLNQCSDDALLVLKTHQVSSFGEAQAYSQMVEQEAEASSAALTSGEVSTVTSATNATDDASTDYSEKALPSETTTSSNEDSDSADITENVDDVTIENEVSVDVAEGFSKVANIAYYYNVTNWFYFAIHGLVFALAIIFIFISKINSSRRFCEIYRFVSLPVFIYLVGEILNVENRRSINFLFPFTLKHIFCIIAIFVIIDVVYFLFYMLTGFGDIAITLTAVLFATVAFVNHTKIVMRGDTFVPWDLLSAGIAVKTGSTYYFHVTKQFVIGIMLCLAILCLIRLTHTTYYKFSHTRLALCALSLSFTLLCCEGLIFNTKLLNKLHVYYEVYPPMQSYNENGTYLALLLHLNNINASGSENNSPEATDEIIYRYQAQAQEMNLDANVAHNSEKPNVICIMSEAYSDLDDIRDFTTNEPATPFFDSVLNNSQHGKLAVSIFGGGTCNTEFEFLTGYSMSSLLPGSSVYTFYVNNNIEALPQLFSENGYRTVALHSFYGDWWDRSTAYPLLGFDEFYTRDDFDPATTQYVRRYISDMSTFQKITSIYDQSEDPLFLFCVTMQNHADFSEHYDNMQYNITINDMLNSEGEHFTYAENYLSLLRQSDDALNYLISYLSQSTEPTMVVYFGDHCPTLDSDFYDTLLDADLGSISLEDSLPIYQTPYFIWTNYNPEELGTCSLDLTDGDKGVISPNFLGQTVLDMAGIDSPATRSCLRVLQTEISAISSVAVYDLDGNPHTDYTGLSSDIVATIDDYAFIQYGLIYYDSDMTVANASASSEEMNSSGETTISGT